jgi:rhodanese-related sulfurtransferase
MSQSEDFQSLAKAAKSRIKEVSAAEAKELIEQGYVVLDIRDLEEFEQGHIENALHLSRGRLEAKISEMIPDKETPIVCHCAGGNRGALAADTLQIMGYRNVVNLDGGLEAFKALDDHD